jgi:fatty acid synthase subunit alpha
MADILGIGVDCEEISRFRELNELFFTRNFTEKERAHCRSRPDPAASFAGRFSCKEAVIKAFGCAGRKVAIDDIEILSREGVPESNIRGQAGLRVMVSISHSRKTAVSVAILMKG